MGEIGTLVQERSVIQEDEMAHRGVILLSGGLDSAVAAWIARQECEDLSALTFDYGQRHFNREVSCAVELSGRLVVKRHLVVNVPIKEIGGSALTDPKGSIPVEGLDIGIPTTWVPQRNAIFLAFAFGWAETLGYDRVYIGANSIDYSGYPDCRPEFLRAMWKALLLGSRQYVEDGQEILLVSPCISMKKSEEILLGVNLGIPFEHTWSCYLGQGKACGRCDSCLIRLRAFREAGVRDPVEYE